MTPFRFFPGALLLSFLLTASFNIPVVHAQKKAAGKPGTVQQQADVYIAGYSSINGQDAVATYYKNGEPVYLADAQVQSEISSIAVVGNDVYACGMHGGQAVYWKNGVETVLTDAAVSWGYALALAVDSRNGDVYVAGYERPKPGNYDKARCWKNGQSIPIALSADPLSRSGVWLIALDEENSDIYLMGSNDASEDCYLNCFWKNGEPKKLIAEEAKNLGVKDIMIAAGEFYVAGKYYVGSDVTTPGYWSSRNGLKLLDNNQRYGEVTSIDVSGNDVYVAGTDMAEDGKVAAFYWKNGIATKLCSYASYEGKYIIAAQGDDAYVAGWGGETESDGSSRCWKNGQLVTTFKDFVIRDIAVVKAGGAKVRTSSVAVTPAKTPAPVASPANKVAATMATSAIEEAKEFLAENQKKQGVVTTPSGLQYEVLNQTDGVKPTANDKVSYVYSRSLAINGTITSDAGKSNPVTLSMKDLLPGLAEGLLLMSPGSRYRLTIPPSLGFDIQQRNWAPNPDYPKGGVVMIFEVELLEIIR